jgi:methyl-accepting chemotaxis protein
LGTLFTILATTAAADVTGIVAASVIAALGLFIIPAQRARAKDRLSEKVADMREKLVASLRQQFERELARSLHGINDAIAPYTRFVRAERGNLEQMQTGLETIRSGIDRLQQQLDDL